MRTRAVYFLSLALVAAACGGKSADPATTAPVETPDAGPEDTAPPPRPQTLEVNEVAVYQGVKVTVAKDGAPIATRNAPIVSGREGVIRVAVKPGLGWKRKQVNAELVLSNGKGQTKLPAKSEIGPLGSTDADYASTFNFEIATGVLTFDMKYHVEVKSVVSATAPEEVVFARYPAEGDEPIDGSKTKAVLKVKIVPVKYDFDGSGRLPAIDAVSLDAYKNALYTLYPTTTVELTVREPYPWPNEVQARGTGWGRLLDAMVKLRAADKSPPDVYYYGMFQANESFSKFCDKGCVAGLSGLLGNPFDSAGRASIGVGYGDDQSAGTLVHEIGHAHGRPHAPCGGAEGIDKKFPYEDGGIGVFGWNVVAKSLVDSTQSDMMGYCDPRWISDYTYARLSERIAYVNGAASIVGADAPGQYRQVRVELDGSLVWGDVITLPSAPLNDPHTITYESPDGKVLSVTGAYYPYSDLPGGYLLVPEPPPQFTRMRVAGLGAEVQSVIELKTHLSKP